MDLLPAHRHDVAAVLSKSAPAAECSGHIITATWPAREIDHGPVPGGHAVGGLHVGPIRSLDSAFASWRRKRALLDHEPVSWSSITAGRAPNSHEGARY